MQIYTQHTLHNIQRIHLNSACRILAGELAQFIIIVWYIRKNLPDDSDKVN